MADDLIEAVENLGEETTVLLQVMEAAKTWGACIAHLPSQRNNI